MVGYLRVYIKLTSVLVSRLLLAGLENVSPVSITEGGQENSGTLQYRCSRQRWQIEKRFARTAVTVSSTVYRLLHGTS